MGNNLDIKTLKVKDIHPYKRNPRKNDGAVDAVAESIRQCGYCAPIVVDENYEVLAGHTRLKAIKKLGWTECEVVVKDGLTEEQKRKYRLLDNKTNELAEWDMELLGIELDGLEFDGFDFGFDTQSEEVIDFEEDEKTEVKWFTDDEIKEAIVDGWKTYDTVQDFASNLIDEASAMFQFNRLCQGYNDGYNISLLFNPHRIDTATRNNGKSMFFGINNDEKYKKEFARYITEVAQRVPPKNDYGKLIGIGCARYQYVNEFQPCLARDIYKRFVREGDKVLNPCAGWGGRLLGFASCMFDNVEYTETDPQTNTYNGLVKLKKFLHLGDNIRQFNLPFEELDVEENYFDFVFTSPPYFDTERYSDEDTQSYVRYNSFENWCSGFLKPMIDKILFCMKCGGICLLNVGANRYNIDTALEAYLDEKGVKHNRIKDFKIGGVGIGDRTGEDGEPFILFEKKEA